MILRSRVKSVACIVLSAALSLFVAQAAGQEMRLFRIGTGGVGGTYYPVGTLIARAVSQPPNSPPCVDSNLCGVPGLVAVAQTANGSVANVTAVGSGVLESGFSQSDVAYWAFSGQGVFKDKEYYPNLRAIAGLYPEMVHIVARKSAAIRSVADLKGKHVSLDEPGSGTLVEARLVLGAYGLSENDIEPEYVKPNLASERLRNGNLDAFFIVAGHPVTSIQELTLTTDIVIVPIDGPERERLLSEHRFFASRVIKAGVYKGVDETPTLSIPAIWVTRADIDETLVYEVTRALWNESSRSLLDNGHVKARAITIETALDGVAIPLHAGAKRYYEQIGLIP